MPAPTKTLDPLGRMLRDARERLELSQSALAMRLGITQSYLSDIEIGKIPSASLIVQIARALSLDEGDLVRAAAARQDAASPTAA